VLGGSEPLPPETAIPSNYSARIWSLVQVVTKLEKET
jgi:hypothetical protein